MAGISLIQKLQKLFGARAVSDMMGRTTNVQTLAQGTNNPFARQFSKKYLAKNPNGAEEAAQSILENMQFGNTGIYGSAVYYLEDLIKNLTVFENKKIVKTFYPKAIIVKERKEIGEQFPNYFDNFIVTNHREDLWVSRQKLIDTHIKDYKTAMKNGCLFFYTIRDTQITPWNRLKENHYNYFLKLAKDIESQLGFKCLHSTIDFPNGDGNENPDTTNGNIKFLFKCIK